MAGLASAWAMARRRPKEYRRKKDAATRGSGLCPFIPDLILFDCTIQFGVTPKPLGPEIRGPSLVRAVIGSIVWVFRRLKSLCLEWWAPAVMRCIALTLTWSYQWTSDILEQCFSNKSASQFPSFVERFVFRERQWLCFINDGSIVHKCHMIRDRIIVPIRFFWPVTQIIYHMIPEKMKRIISSLILFKAVALENNGS